LGNHDLAIFAGVLDGAIEGNKIEKKAKKTKSYDITVKVGCENGALNFELMLTALAPVFSEFRKGQQLINFAMCVAVQCRCSHERIMGTYGGYLYTP